MDKKYTLTDKTRTTDNGHVVHRIRALRDVGTVKAGALGGWVESENNLSHDGQAWVSDNARVTGDARVSSDARVFGDAQICGRAQICGSAWVFSYAEICGGATVGGDARVQQHGRAHRVESAVRSDVGARRDTGRGVGPACRVPWKARVAQVHPRLHERRTAEPGRPVGTGATGGGRMTTAERSLQIERLWREQGGVCYYCGLSLAEWSTRCFSRGMGDGMELAHRVPRGELRRAGVDEWHPLALRLVCTRKGKRCNDGAMELTGLPRQSVIDEIREDMNAKTC